MCCCRLPSSRRELIGERVRDKIAASKRKGIWVGGPVPLGYAAVNKKICVVPAEAEAVRRIFARYLELGSVRALAGDIGRRSIRSKSRRLSDGRTVGGGSFGVGALAHLLKNRFYIGEVGSATSVDRGGSGRSVRVDERHSRLLAWGGRIRTPRRRFVEQPSTAE
jgi:site-specific DNA recombinase